MIVTRTPLRISLAGGGSDIPNFYRSAGGAVLSFSINKNVYIACHGLYSGGIRLSYSKTERVAKPQEISHPLIRETLLALDFQDNIEIGSFADVPASGTGLGSSSVFTVGLINALGTYMRKEFSPHTLAETACEVEISRCGEPIGKQDQFAAAYGGINRITFNADDSVNVESIYTDSIRDFLDSTMLLFDLGFGRKAGDILVRQNVAMSDRDSFDKVAMLKDMVVPMEEALRKTSSSEVANLLRESWQQKKMVVSGINTGEIDEVYEFALKCGAIAGKVVGAGGGGFLLLMVEPGWKEVFREKFRILRELPFQVNRNGSEVVLSDGD